MRRSKTLRRELLVLAAIALLVASLPVAQAQQAPSISLSPTNGEVGTSVTVTGSDFEGTGEVSIFLGEIGGVVLAVTPIANRFGDLEPAQFEIPDIAPGRYVVLACRYFTGTEECLGLMARAVLEVLPTTTTTTSPTTTQPEVTTTAPEITTTTDEQIGLISTTTSSMALSSVTTIGGDPPGPSGPTGVAFTTTSTSIDVPGSFAGEGEGPFPDIEVTAVELTQGIQDLGNRMPLVANKRTLIRVYVAADRSGSEFGGFQSPTTADENAANLGNEGWDNVDGLVHLEGGGQDEVIYALNAPITAYPRGSDRIEAGETLNFEIPDGWTDGEVEITVLVWSYLPSTIVSSEPDAGNNYAQGTVVFQESVSPLTAWFRLDTMFGEISDGNWGDVMSDAAQSYITYHPVASPNFFVFWPVLGPGEMVGDEEPSESFDYVNARSEPLWRMRYFHALFGMEDLERIHGMIPSGTPSDGGGLTSWNSLVAWSKPTETTPAHEAAHMYFIKHAPCQDDDDDGQPDEVGGGGWGWVDQTYPAGLPSCSIAPEDPAGYYGTRLGDEAGEFTVYSNDPGVPPVRYPYMSYQDPSWVDAYHYCLLMETYEINCNPESIGLTPKTPPGSPVDCGPLLGGGIVIDLCLWNGQGPVDTQGGPAGSLQLALSDEEPSGYLLVDVDIGSGQLGHAELLEPTASLQNQFEFVAARAKNGDMANHTMLRVADTSGHVLAQIPVSSNVGGHSDTSEAPNSVELIPWFEGAASLDLIQNDSVVDERRPSGAPVVDIDPFDPSGAREFRFSWSATDPEGDTLLYTPSWSNDGGGTWRALDTRMTGTSARVFEDLMLPGGEILIKVTASDGLATGSAIAGPFTVPSGSPSGVVVVPASVPQYTGERMTFQATDPEDGQITEGTWSSSIDGELGAGHIVGMSSLSLGLHEISVSMVDSDGNTANIVGMVEVVPSANDAPRLEGAEPEAEQLVRLGPDNLDQFEIADALPEDDAETVAPSSMPWVPLTVGGGLILLLTAGLIFRRMRQQ